MESHAKDPRDEEVCRLRSGIERLKAKLTREQINKFKAERKAEDLRLSAVDRFKEDLLRSRSGSVHSRCREDIAKLELELATRQSALASLEGKFIVNQEALERANKVNAELQRQRTLAVYTINTLIKTTEFSAERVREGKMTSHHKADTYETALEEIESRSKVLLKEMELNPDSTGSKPQRLSDLFVPSRASGPKAATSPFARQQQTSRQAPTPIPNPGLDSNVRSNPLAQPSRPPLSFPNSKPSSSPTVRSGWASKVTANDEHYPSLSPAPKPSLGPSGPATLSMPNIGWLNPKPGLPGLEEMRRQVLRDKAEGKVIILSAEEQAVSDRLAKWFPQEDDSKSEGSGPSAVTVSDAEADDKVPENAGIAGGAQSEGDDYFDDLYDVSDDEASQANTRCRKRSDISDAEDSSAKRLRRD